jgi:hypothetical protein
MSDISLNFEWWEWLIASPVLGWPGLIGGGALGAALWPKRRFLGGALGAIIGNLIVFVARILLK